MGTVKKRLHIGGMTCINCQNKIESRLKNTAGIEAASVSYSTGTAEISYDSSILTLKDIEAVIEQLGYEVLPETKKQETDIGKTVGLLVIIVLLYGLLQHFGVLNLLAPSRLADTGMGYGMLFVVGLLTSVHCIAMCGGINLSQCIPHCGDQSGTAPAALRPAFLYNLGRVISYTVIGFLLGFLGMMLGGDSGTGLSTLVQGIIKMIAGCFMIIMGITMLGLFPWLRRFNLRMPGIVAVKLGRKKAEGKQPLVVGLLNGLMPCGPLQSMQLVALASGNPFSGALAMLMFSLGTVPLMLGLGSLVSALGRRFTKEVMNVGSVLVVVLGLAMLSQGGSLSGLLLPDRLFVLIIMLCLIGTAASLPSGGRQYRAVGMAALVIAALGAGTVWGSMGEKAGLSEEETAAEEIEITDGIQVVNSTLTPGRYPNITVQVGIPVKWVIDAPAGSITGCNYKLLLNEYGIVHEFTEGENIIEFTPTKTGTVQYTCWMGMLRGTIFVTDGDSTAEAASKEQGTEAAADVPVPSGYQIPSDRLAVAQRTTDETGEEIQEVRIELTEDGFSPAVIVAEAGLPVAWYIDNSLEDAENGTDILAPLYYTELQLVSGENVLYLYPQESFEISTGDNRFYAYVKVVDDIEQIDEDAIRQEVDAFETLIYPASIFEDYGMSCCG